MLKTRRLKENGRNYVAVFFFRIKGSSQTEALFQKDTAGAYTQHKTNQSHIGIQISGGHTDDHAQWTSRKPERRS